MIGWIGWRRKMRTKRKAIGETTGTVWKRQWQNGWRRWLGYEWQLMNATMSLGRLIQLLGLVGLNIVQLLREQQITSQEISGGIGSFDRGHRDLYQQEMANRTGQLALANFAVAVALSARYSVLLRPFGVDQTRRWHMWFARIGCCCTLYHTCYQFARNYPRQNYDLWLAFSSNIRYTTGFYMILATVFLFAGAHPLVRTLSYRFFRYSHLLAFGVIVLVGFLHHWTFAIFYLATFGIWLVDQFQQFGFGSRQAQLISMDVLSGNVLKLQVQPSYDYKAIIPGQFILLSLQKSRIASWFDTHPFSIARVDAGLAAKTTDEIVSPVNPFATTTRPYSAYLETDSGQATLTLYIKAIGKRTIAWYRMARSVENVSSIPVFISKPLGTPFLDAAGRGYGDFEQVVLVAEGIGITPWISLLQYLEQQQHHIRTKELVFIWTIRDTGKNKSCAIRIWVGVQGMLNI
ncbi:hypothetical protein EC973_006902 [Apophysomyces ossiformis]|uniref:FAD-binding FR-type domain-containing protein n=1 Tax=Apophysomyces ossiformis TaxID=679940 RepID=A0A8H7BVC3_9FUNG|nr:hypothetical protein EC973_006902 [Apophysomyces ossiformis]